MNFIKALCDLMAEKEVEFVFNGKPISYDAVFAETGLLPGIARRADRLCSLCLGYGIGVTFTEAEKSITGAKVQFDEVTPNMLRLMCIYDVLLDIITMAPSPKQVVLDDLMYD